MPGSARPLCGETYCMDGRKVDPNIERFQAAIVQRLGNYPGSQCYETIAQGQFFWLGLDIAPQSVIEEEAAPSIEANLTLSER